MQTRLIAIGNSYGIRIPKSIIQQLNLDKKNIEISVKDNGILITPVADVPPLSEWDNLFKQAIRAGFDVVEDRNEFKDFDTTFNDGNSEL